jgi:hypothetical protein
MRKLLVLVALLGGCDPFAAAQKADTIEAYEQFLAENPTSPWALQAQSRLETLTLEKARTEHTLAAYDAWLTRFPMSTLADDVREEREGKAFEWAAEAGTIEAFEGYLAEYPETRRRSDVERLIRIARCNGCVAMENLRAHRVNLGEVADGPLDGWMLEADVRNTGEAPLPTVILSPRVTDVALDGDWPVAAPSWRLPLPEETLAPLAPGETRTWTWSTGRLPETWDGQFRLVVMDVRSGG